MRLHKRKLTTFEWLVTSQKNTGHIAGSCETLVALPLAEFNAIGCTSDRRRRASHVATFCGAVQANFEIAAAAYTKGSCARRERERRAGHLTTDVCSAAEERMALEKPTITVPSEAQGDVQRILIVNELKGGLCDKAGLRGRDRRDSHAAASDDDNDADGICDGDVDSPDLTPAIIDLVTEACTERRERRAGHIDAACTVVSALPFAAFAAADCMADGGRRERRAAHVATFCAAVQANFEIAAAAYTNGNCGRRERRAGHLTTLVCGLANTLGSSDAPDMDVPAEATAVLNTVLFANELKTGLCDKAGLGDRQRRAAHVAGYCKTTLDSADISANMIDLVGEACGDRRERRAGP